MCITPPMKFKSAVEDFSPRPAPTPADFSDRDGDEREEEEPLGFQPAETQAQSRDVRICATVDN